MLIPYNTLYLFLPFNLRVFLSFLFLCLLFVILLSVFFLSYFLQLKYLSSFSSLLHCVFLLISSCRSVLLHTSLCLYVSFPALAYPLR